MIVIVEFPNLEQARAWYRSPESAFALEVRDTALSRNRELARHQGDQIPIGPARHFLLPRARLLADIESQGEWP
jgi:hypothetical protein